MVDWLIDWLINLIDWLIDLIDWLIDWWAFYAVSIRFWGDRLYNRTSLGFDKTLIALWPSQIEYLCKIVLIVQQIEWVCIVDIYIIISMKNINCRFFSPGPRWRRRFRRLIRAVMGNYRKRKSRLPWGTSAILRKRRLTRWSRKPTKTMTVSSIWRSSRRKCINIVFIPLVYWDYVYLSQLFCNFFLTYLYIRFIFFADTLNAFSVPLSIGRLLLSIFSL